MSNAFPRSRSRGAAFGFAAASIATTCFLPAQETVDPSTLQESASPVLPGPTGPDGRSSGLWANGRNYKVSFHDGMTFYPHVGPGLPHQPLRWRTTSVRAGGVELVTGAGTPVPVYCGQRCEYDLGGVTERYDVLAGGLEQSFVVHAKPAAGDLVITGELGSPLLLAESAPRHGELSLCLEDGTAAVGYGKAFALDADGVSTPVEAACDGRTIELRVAAATVAAARFPLVVDPLISNTLLEQGAPIDEVDVLHETLTASGLQARTWVAYSRTVAAGDHDIWLRRYAPAFGNGAGTEQYREITIFDSTGGRLALAPAASRVVMVFSIDSGTNRWVYVHSHHTLDNNLVTSIVGVPSNLGLSDWRPDVGGRLQPNGNKVLITFQREAVAPFANTATSSVQACVFDASVSSSTAFVVQPFTVLPRANRDQERPVVNQFAASNNWLLAFQEHNGAVANDDWDIVTMALDDNGNATATGLDTAHEGDPLLHKVGPQVAGAYGRYLLTYTTRVFELPNPKPAVVRGEAIYAQRLDWDHGTATGSLPWPVVALQSSASSVLQTSGLAFDPITQSHWCAAMLNAGTNNYRLHKLGYTGNVVETAPIALGAGETVASIAVASNQELHTFLVAFGANSATAGLSTLYGTQMQYEAVAPPTTIGFSCGSGVWSDLTATAERQQIGSENLGLSLAGAPQETLALLLFSTAQLNLPADPFGAPGCVLVPDIFGPAYMGFLTSGIVGGAASVTVDLPEYLAPMTLVLQWCYATPGANALGFQASEGLSLQLGR